MTKAEVEAFINDDEFRLYVNSELFHRRGIELERRSQTEPLTVEDSAKIVGLPVDVFIFIKGHEMAGEALKQNLGTEH